MTSNLEGLAAPTAQPDGPQRALVIAAHPDDADFGAAGTVHLWSVGLGVLLPGVHERRQGQRRRIDVGRASSSACDAKSSAPPQALLGVKDVFFLDNEDGELTPNRDFLRRRPLYPARPISPFSLDLNRSSCATLSLTTPTTARPAWRRSTPSIRPPATASTSLSRRRRVVSRTRSARSTYGARAARTTMSTSPT